MRAEYLKPYVLVCFKVGASAGAVVAGVGELVACDGVGARVDVGAVDVNAGVGVVVVRLWWCSCWCRWWW